MISFYLTVCLYVSSSRPTPEILWYRNNVLITALGDHFRLELFNRTLRLGSLSSSTHDGSYKCVAVSGLLKEEASFGIKVIGMNTSFVTFNSDFKEPISPYNIDMLPNKDMWRKQITVKKAEFTFGSVIN